MKKFGVFTATVMMAVGVAACGTAEDNGMNDNIIVNEGGNETENADMNSEENTTENNQINADDSDSPWYENLTFYEFDLNVEYADGDYEVEYEYHDGNPKAEIEDTRDRGNIDIKGQEALDELENILPELDLTSESTDEEVFTAVINAFDLNDDYDELEVEIDFFDNSKLEAEDE